MPTAAITSAVAAKIANSSMLKRRCEMLSSTTWSMAYTSCTGWSLSIAQTCAVTADVMRSGSPAVRTISARLGNWLRDGKNISGRGGLSRPSWRVSATTPNHDAPPGVRITIASRCGSRKGMARSSMAFKTEKMAVLAPMPSARVMAAARVKPGFLRRTRKAYRMTTTPFSGSCRTRARSKTHRKLLKARPGGLRGRRRPRACPTAGFSSLFVGRRPILTDLEVCPTLVERRPGSTADESGIDGGDGVGPFVTAPSEKKLYHGVATRANRQTHRIAVQQVLEAKIAPRDRHLARVRQEHGSDGAPNRVLDVGTEQHQVGGTKAVSGVAG